jgi:hypothetical protein
MILERRNMYLERAAINSVNQSIAGGQLEYNGAGLTSKAVRNYWRLR